MAVTPWRRRQYLDSNDSIGRLFCSNGLFSSFVQLSFCHNSPRSIPDSNLSINMLEMFTGLSPVLGICLILSLVFVIAYEFINGFHDTANAVATVIYTKAMPPHMAVVASGIFNFAGVMLGGLGVAYAIVHLLPVDLLLNVASAHGLVMVFSCWPRPSCGISEPGTSVCRPPVRTP